MQPTQVDHLAAPHGHGKVPLRHSGGREREPHLGQLGLSVYAGSFIEEAVVAYGWKGSSADVVGWWVGRQGRGKRAS